MALTAVTWTPVGGEDGAAGGGRKGEGRGKEGEGEGGKGRKEGRGGRGGWRGGEREGRGGREGMGREGRGGEVHYKTYTYKEARVGGMDKGLLIPAKRPLLDLLIITSFRHAYESDHGVRSLPYFSDGRH